MDNKFDAEVVMKRWQYIHDQLNQRGIHLVSIGADGDSRELKGMPGEAELGRQGRQLPTQLSTS